MATLDPRSIKPDNHKKIRKLDGSQGVATLKSLESSTNNASKEYAPILQAVVELVKLYQSDTNVEDDERVLKLANLILDRHTALLNALTKDSDSWYNVKKYIEAKIGTQVLQYNVDNSNSAKDDVSVVTKKINDAITKALIEYNKKHKVPEDTTIKQSQKNVNTIEIDQAIVKEKTSSLMQSKEYKNFLVELKSDFEGFVKDYDANKKILIDNYKKAIVKNIVKVPPKKKNILTGLTDVFKDKPITKKDRQPKKSLNPFRSFDVTGLVKNVAHGIQTFVGASTGIIVKFFSGTGRVFKAAAKIMKSLVFSAIGAMAEMLNGFLNLFGRGPIIAIFSMIILPIKFIVKGIMFVVKPLVKLISGLAKIILAPIKILVLGPIKLIKGLGSFVKGIFGGILKLLNKRTLKALFKIFLTAGGAFMLGYIVGTIWRWLKPTYLNIVNFISEVQITIDSIKTLIYGSIDDMSAFFKSVFDKDQKPKPPSLAYKLHVIVNNLKDAWNFISGLFGAGNAFDPVKIYNGALNAFGILKEIIAFLTNPIIKTVMRISTTLYRALTGPVARACKGLSGIPKFIGIAIAIITQAIKDTFNFFSRKKDAPITLKSQFQSSQQPDVDKATYLNEDTKKEYEGLLAGINREADDLSKLDGKMQEEIIDVCKKRHGKLTDYPGYLNSVITSYVMGESNPETLSLPKDFSKMSLEDQIASVNDILQKRHKRADQLKGILLANNKDAVLKLLADRRSNPSALKLSNFKNELISLTNEGFKGRGKVVIAGGIELKAGRNIKIDRAAVTDQTMLEDMRTAGLITSGDSWWNFGDGEYQIKGDAEAMAHFQSLRNERRVKEAQEMLEKIGWFTKQNPLDRLRIQKRLSEYFKTADLNGKTDDQLRKEALEYAQGAVDEAKRIVKKQPNVEKQLGPTVEALKAATDELKKADSSSNTTIINTTQTDNNHAMAEVNMHKSRYVTGDY